MVSQSIVEGSTQYRNRYAEPESGLAALCPESFDMVMAVPVCAESAAFVDGYRSAAAGAGRLLVIAVLNGRVGADDSVHASNVACARELTTRFSLRELGRDGWLGHDANLSVLVVDRFRTGRRLPAKQGVAPRRLPLYVKTPPPRPTMGNGGTEPSMDRATPKRCPALYG